MNEENSFNPQSAEEEAAGEKRPLIITIACVIGAIGAVMSVPLIFSDLARGLGAWYAPYIAGSVLASLVCVIGLWKMRRWGAYLYAGVAITNQLVIYSMGMWHFPDLAVPAVFAAIAFSQLHKMR
ncbi:MAG: hypothetical protein A2X35_01680 [Elusimicrobia bacterium GWA2_61_42]|nr:MAG: hypothetical protein A2X35_01680 [Elusimicrobia bacterium GWA2_61_42]OGR76857.1 MAG: hypothetical protein A2X38_11855 [Elusimicrobia bacterium GWC2_61_25]